MLIAVGLTAGVLSGLFGIGGGVVIVAALVAFAKFPIHLATGTSLAALLLPVGLLGAREYWRNGHVDPRAAAILAGGILVGAWVGARWAQTLHPVALQRAFAIFLVVIAARLWFKSG